MIDTSALVKYYHPEVGSPQVIAIADNPDNTLFLCADTQLCSAAQEGGISVINPETL
jgi:hypothetical protein